MKNWEKRIDFVFLKKFGKNGHIKNAASMAIEMLNSDEGLVIAKTNDNAICETCRSKVNGQGFKLDGTLIPNTKLPTVGDVTICVYCKTVSKFDENYNLVPLIESEIKYLKEKYNSIWKKIEEVISSFIYKQKP